MRRRRFSIRTGRLLLQDVGIVLYGQGEWIEAKSQPETVDRIYGKEFEYDQNARVMRSIGEVHIDLQAPARRMRMRGWSMQRAGMLRHTGGWGSSMIHVKTSGLVYVEQLGLAATGQEV